MLKYYIGGELHYVLPNGEHISQSQKEEIDKRNYEKGYQERMAGFYDKWYRYNAYDSGKMYDRGCMDATLQPKCKPECQIIEYNSI